MPDAPRPPVDGDALPPASRPHEPDDPTRRAFWTAQMDAADAFMRRITQHPVAECAEPMVFLPDATRAAGVEERCHR